MLFLDMRVYFIAFLGAFSAILAIREARDFNCKDNFVSCLSIEHTLVLNCRCQGDPDKLSLFLFSFK